MPWRVQSMPQGWHYRLCLDLDGVGEKYWPGDTLVQASLNISRAGRAGHIGHVGYIGDVSLVYCHMSWPTPGVCQRHSGTCTSPDPCVTFRDDVLSVPSSAVCFQCAFADGTMACFGPKVCPNGMLCRRDGLVGGAGLSSDRGVLFPRIAPEAPDCGSVAVTPPAALNARRDGKGRAPGLRVTRANGDVLKLSTDC